MKLKSTLTLARELVAANWAGTQEESKDETDDGCGAPRLGH